MPSKIMQMAVSMRMFRPTFFVLYVALFTVMSGQSKEPNYDVNQQCIDRGFLGACIDVDVNGDINPYMCYTLKCAHKHLYNGLYSMEKIGHAIDGTSCGYSKMCVHGFCYTITARDISKNKGGIPKYRCAIPH